MALMNYSKKTISVRGTVANLMSAVVVEEYPDYPKGGALLVLQYEPSGKPVHVVWGIPRGHATPAVLITAYRPDALRWSDDFMRRRK